MLKKTVKSLFHKFGYDVGRIRPVEKPDSIVSGHSETNTLITDIEKLAQRGEHIPGMINPSSGQMLYTLCYMQPLHGDVVEIGSWQGRSTFFLGNAVKDSKNGSLYAIDHFKGNFGKEDLYKIDGSLSGLSGKFLSNITEAGLIDYVNLLDMPSGEAAQQLSNAKIRFLFVDGDHTYEGVKTDIELFFPKLLTGSIVVFDDYFEGFPGLIRAIDELVIEKEIFSRIFYYEHTLVIEIR